MDPNQPNPTSRSQPEPGERTAADWLAACRDDLVRFCQRYLGQVADAEDAVQDLAAKLDRAAGVTRPRAWLFRVARNHCLNLLRDKPGAARQGGSLFLDPQVASPRTGPRTALDRSESTAALREAISALPADLAEVLTLRYFDGFGRAEIADVLQRTDGEVKRTLARAREELARKLFRFGEGTA